MKETFIEKIEHTRTICDFCNGENKGYRVKQCNICHKDICTKCAILTDSDYLKEGCFMGDYPDYYCHVCWDRGKEIREEMQKLRDETGEKEYELFEKWRRI